MRTLDLSLRFFKKSGGNRWHDIILPEGLNNTQYFGYFKALRGYDDEQKLILMAMHYNTQLKLKIFTLAKSV